MAKGLERREVVQDRFTGARQVQVQNVPQTPVQSPRPTSSRDVGGVQQSLAEIAKFGSRKFAEMAATKKEQDEIAGRIAYSQGKTLTELEDEGVTGHTLDGYRMMQAASTASAMFEAQAQRIRDGDYELSPDEYRDQLGKVVADSTKGLDPATARLTLAQFSEQMPRLAGMHMREHYAGIERKTFSALADAVATVSRDPASHSALRVFAAGGPDSPAGSLSDERRTAAVVEGVRRAFAEDNPYAFAVLDQQGVLEGLPLSADQKGAVMNARNAYENRQREFFNAQYFETVRNTEKSLKAGSISLTTAMKRIAAANAELGVRTKTSDMSGLYAIDEARIAAAQAKIDAARKKAEEKAEREAEAERYMMMQFHREGLDKQLSDGSITRGQYVARTMELYSDYEQEFTKSAANSIYGATVDIQNAEIKRQQEAAEAAQDEAAAANLANFQRAMIGPRAEFERTGDAEAYYEARDAIAAELGVPIDKRGEGAAANSVVRKLVAADKERVKAEAEETSLRAAITTGSLYGLSPQDRQKAFDLYRADLAEKFNAAVEDGMPVEEAQKQMGEELLEFTMNSGAVNDRLKDTFSNALTYGVLDSNGRATESAINALAALNDMQAANPKLAEEYITDAARPVVTMARDMMNGPGTEAEALEMAAQLIQNGRPEEVAEQLATPLARQQIATLSEHWIKDQDNSVLGALLDTNSTIRQAFDILPGERAAALERVDVVKSLIQNEAEKELLRNPGLTREAAVKIAGERVNQSVALFGGDIVVAGPGQNIQKLMFGERATDFDMKAAPTRALMMYLREFGSDPSVFGDQFNSFGFDRIAEGYETFAGIPRPDSIFRESVKNAWGNFQEYLRGSPELSITSAPYIEGAEPGIMVRYKKGDGTWSARQHYIPYKDLGDLLMEAERERYSN